MLNSLQQPRPEPDPESDQGPVDPQPDDMPHNLPDQSVPDNFGEGPVESSLPPNDPPVTRPRASVEDEDEEEGTVWIEDYPDDDAGRPIRYSKTEFQLLFEADEKNKRERHFPFKTRDEWELASWLMTSGLSRNEMDKHLDLPTTRKLVKPDFHNSRALLQRIDALPTGPAWKCKTFPVEGNIKDRKGNLLCEEVDLWYRNPVECIQELLGNPGFQGHVAFAPHRAYRAGKGSGREISEMWTADWWWEKQGLIPKGGTVAPVILSSDKTNLTRFAGDKSAWPVYLSIGNISKDIRRKPTERAMVLIGYIPVTKLECFTEDQRSVEIYRLFHVCMRKLLRPLLKAGQNGVEMTCADGFLRLVFPILAAYIADYPEQCLVCAVKENSCPTCDVRPEARGDFAHKTRVRDQTEILAILEEVERGGKTRALKDKNLRAVNPFWREFPHCNIYETITPDLLHQLHKGVFKDHVVSWATKALPGGTEEVDARFKAMTHHPDVRHFSKGISVTSQWTGREHKNMQKVFLGVLAGATDPRVIIAVRSILDFIYYAHFSVHTEESLERLDHAWLTFHKNKDIFLKYTKRKHFNISKLHNIRHYVDFIRSHGTTDGTNTESTERLHIDLAKLGYAASNHKDYIAQMTKWLSRQEAVDRFARYLLWADEYAAAKARAPQQKGSASAEEKWKEPEVQKEVQKDIVHSLAKKPHRPATTLVEASAEYGAPDLFAHLTTFLGNDGRAATIRESTQLLIYRRAGLLLPPIREVSTESEEDRLHTVPGEKFSTALFRKGAARVGAGPLDGVSVGQVRLIFRLPAGSGVGDTTMVYVRWFDPLDDFVEGVGMFKTAFAKQNGRQVASVVRLDTVLRSCHLIPDFGNQKAQWLGWKADTIFDQAPAFYLNPYLRHYDFFLLRHQLGMFLDSQPAQNQKPPNGGKTVQKRRGRK